MEDTTNGDGAAHVAEVDPGQATHPLLGLALSAERLLRAAMEDVLAPYSLTPPEWAVIYHLWHDASPPFNAELARRVYVTPQAVGQIIGGLERRGLLSRHPDPLHGRRRLAQLTPKGRELAAQCFESLSAVQQQFLSALNPREQTYFLDMLSECVNEFARGRPPSVPAEPEG